VSDQPLSLIHEVIRPAGAGPHPVLLLLHGRGADEHDLLPLAEAFDQRFLVISARAPLERFGGYHWYDLVEMGVPEPATFADSLGRLQRFVREVLAAFPLAGGKIYLLGFSQGAMMSGSLLLTIPDQIAGAVLLSGYLPLEQGLSIPTERLAGKPVFIGHGTADRVLPIALGRQSRDYLRGAGVDLTYREYAMPHQISQQEHQDVAVWLRGHLDNGHPPADGRSAP
jgi:phospholipase/carboxylesterase